MDSYFDTAVFPYYALHEKALFMFNREMDAGLYITEAEAIRLYRDKFMQSYAKAALFTDMHTDLMAFLNDNDISSFLCNNDQGCEFYVIENNPCILVNVNSDVQSYIADLPGAHEMAMQYCTFLQMIFDNVSLSHSLFSQEGLEEMIHAKEYYEFDRHLSKSIPLEFRRKALCSVIEYSSGESNYAPMLIKLPIFDETNVRVINLWSDGKMIVLYSLEDSFGVLLLNDIGIVTELIGYYKTLMPSWLP